MHISSITLSGFQCFGPEPTEIQLEEGLTALIGANASGKTALLQALLRLFGFSQSERQVRPEDFYVAPDKEIDDEDERSLWIDVRIEFPELAHEENSGIAPFFYKMNVSDAEPPFVRGRLEATWRKDVTPEGSIEEEAVWVLSDEDPENGVSDDDAQRMSAYERGQILVEYIPAQRSAIDQVRKKTGSIVSQLIRSINWSSETKETVEKAAEEIRESAGSEDAMQIINDALRGEWGELHDGLYDANPTLHVVEQHFRDLVRTVDVSFEPSEVGTSHRVDALSDGLQSLFYLSLLVSYQRILLTLDENNASNGSSSKDTSVSPPADVAASETDAATSDASEISANESEKTEDQPAFIRSKISAPSLVILALEEPENHLAPYYLSRIISQLRDLINSNRIQALMTSHSASTLTRIQPQEVRHLRLQRESRTTTVQPIHLPTADEDLHKYVREAVQAYPELYFARFVVFGEGDSEEIVLPRLARALGIEFDPSFVAMVPLGGRHVNHFWRLVQNLGIPHATLLDLDVGRSGAGWGRIKYALNELLKVRSEQEVLQRDDGISLSQQEVQTLDQDNSLTDRDEMNAWIEHLQRFGVFFSEPLDLDWLLLSSFESTYHDSAPNQPRGTVESALSAVLKDQNEYDDAREAGFYSENEEERFRWYRYLFDTKSKPATHLSALGMLDNDEIEQNIPDPLRTLLTYVDDRVSGNSM